MEERIMDRVRKMLALANDAAASEGERDNALRMAYNLLAKHNLTLADVEAKSREQTDPRVEEKLDSWSQLWAKHIFNAMAKLFFCRYHYSLKINATKCRHHFIGRSSNTTTAALMGEYLVTSILRECRRNWKHNLAPESRAFAIGASDRIRQRVNQLIREKEAELGGTSGSTGTALVLASLYRTEDDANEFFLAERGIKPETDTSRQGRVEDAEAYWKGFEYGDNVSLHVQVGSDKKAGLLG